MSRVERRTWWSRLGLVCLVLAALVVLVAARGSTKYDMGDDYFNDVKMTSAAMMRFAKTTTGAADSTAGGDYGANTKRTHFVDILNECSTEAALRVYGPQGFGVASSGTTNVIIYLPDGAARSIDGWAVDSISVDTATGIGAGAPIYFSGAVKR